MEVSLLAGGSNGALETVKILRETVSALGRAFEGSEREIFRPKTQEQVSPPLTQDGSLRRSFLLESMDCPWKTEDAPPESPPKDGESKPDSGTESDDIDDIELVFTTGETDLRSIHEDLVPIVEEKDDDDGGDKSPSNDGVIETDISKCGVLEDKAARRNTLPNPPTLPYRPILHREILAASETAPGRSPCQAEALLPPPTHETAAQTDITALPAQWKSETHLAHHKMSCNLTTLPSKFTLPVPRTKRLLPLSDKTREARRVLLSDINFTSMVPELSRSADYLHDEKTATTKASIPFDECESPRMDEHRESTSGSCCGSRTSIPPFTFACDSDPRHGVRVPWRTPHVGCCHATTQLWSSVPSSPVECLLLHHHHHHHRHHHHYHQESEESLCRTHSRRRRTKVRFLHCDPACGRSLPNLRPESDGGESTDSLLEETEEFLRRSVDSMLITRTPSQSRERRSSDAEPVSGFEPPKTARAFLPKSAEDLQEGCHVKVITPGGRIVVGKVRYAGEVPTEPEPHVGVELAEDDDDAATGFSDGVFMGRRFFECGRNRAVFVPFRKVVVAWDI